jgi:hypothetical protein
MAMVGPPTYPAPMHKMVFSKLILYSSNGKRVINYPLLVISRNKGKKCERSKNVEIEEKATGDI